MDVRTRFLNLRKGHTYKLFFNVTRLIEWYGDDDIPYYAEELDEQFRAVYINYFIDATFNGYDNTTGIPKLKLYVLKTNVLPLEINHEYLFDVSDFTRRPVDITSKEELESFDGDYYEMILRKINADRLAHGRRPLPFGKYMYRLGHKRTRKPTINYNTENGFDTVDGGKRRPTRKKF